MSILLSEKKTELIKSIANRQGLIDYTIDVNCGSVKGDGYLGIINTIDIRDKNNHELNLILKSAEENEKVREQTPVQKAYEREIFMYETIFPEFKQFQEENGVANKFEEIPKCYGTSSDVGHEFLVLENLKKIGYKLWNRMVPMNLQHVEQVFATYGKLHAVSLAMKTLEPERYRNFSENLENIFKGDQAAEKQMQATCEQVVKSGFEAVAGNEKATNAFTEFTKGLMEYFKELDNMDDYTVVTHGDCWCNNMLFKYEDINDPLKPTKVCLLDWQIARKGSPILDLSYFFYASTSKEVLYDLDKCLKVYYDNLAAILKDCGCNPDKVFPYSELENQWKLHSRFGLFLAFLIVKVMLTEVEDVIDLNVIADTNTNFIDAIASADCTHGKEYLKRIRDVIVFMTDRNFL